MTSTTPTVPLKTLMQTDTTLRRLLTITLVDTLARGAFFTLTTLYLTLIVGLEPVTVGIGLTIAGAVGVASSLTFGHLSDRLSARRMLVVLHLVQSVGLMGYLFVRDLPTLVVVASLVLLAQRGGQSVRSAAVGRAFLGRDRVRIRATMRTVTNIGIGVGTALAAIPLALGTAFAFQLTMTIAGALFLVVAFLVAGLDPHRVDVQRQTPDAESSSTTATTNPRSPYRDPRFLWLTALMGVFGIQFGVFEIAVPLWVVAHTIAPDVVVSPLLLVNTIVVVLLQVRMSRGTGTFAGAGRAMTRAGWLMVAACALWAGAGWVEGEGWGPVTLVILVLLAAAVVHSLAEITSSAAGWNLSFDLAPQERMGSYQGVYGTGYAVGSMIAPAVVTLTAIDLGGAGWAILAAMFAVAAGGVVVIARRAEAASRR
ncbi:MFS transporter [Microbacterium testaceum]|uniref:MFS transporter n=1 Tax=Microbacterium testaceum TaxID=2033 RepID=UPI0017821ADA|nr:MFS transporter [Microbacterium testaceum]